MKGKTKHILGVALTLMMVVSLLMWTAPVSADTLEWKAEDPPEELAGVDIVDIAVAEGGVAIYAATGFGSVRAMLADYGTATWDGTKSQSGDYSAKLDHAVTPAGSVHVEFVPQSGITVAEFEANVVGGTIEWSFWHWLENTGATNGPQFELRFEDPDSVGWVEITAVGLQSTIGTEDWLEEVLAGTTMAGFGGVNQLGVSFFGWDTPGLVDIDGIETDINNDTDGPDDCGDWELARVRLELFDAIDQDCYIDSVTIDDVFYDLEAGLYVSTDTGESWEDLTVVVDSTIISAAFVAVSPDDPRYIAVANTGGTVYISDDGGATYETLGDSGVANVADIAVSVESGGNRFFAVAGDDRDSGDAGDGNAEVFYYEIGAIGADWTEISDDTPYPGWDAGDIAGAVAFSPNFLSDELLAVVSFDDTPTPDELLFQIFTFNQNKWNDQVSGFTTDYPVNLNIGDVDVVTALNSASIAMSPEYLGSDDDLRQAFVGLATDDADTSGIFLVDDDSVDALKDEEFIRSVDFDGTNLVAGSYDGTTVFRSDDALEGEDADVDSSSSKKSPGGEFRTVVAFAGDAVVAGTSGDESSFSVSGNSGKTFNDISLIDTSLDEVLDVALSADGSVIYLLSADGTGSADLSLWRLADDAWVRVLSRPGEPGADEFILRIAPDDADVIYLARTGDSNLYYSSDGGETKWHNRTSKYSIVDLAVETDGGVAYVLTTSGYVSKSDNSGFTWGGKETTGQAGSSTIVSLGEDLVLVGGSPAVSYSTDGNESWIDLDELDDDGLVQVTASGLADGDFIYASTDVGDSYIYRWEIGDGEWEDDLGQLDTDFECRGIGLANGTLYVLAEDTSDSKLIRFLDPAGDKAGDESTANATGVLFDRTPSALRISAGSTNLWAVTSDSGELFNFEDTIATVAPTLKGPKSGFTVPINEISGEPADVNFSWESPSDEVETFDLKVAVDDEFDEVVFDSGDLTAGCIDEDGDEGDLISYVMDDNDYALMPGETYYWRVRVSQDAPVQSPWSATWSFTVEEAEAIAPVVLEIPPQPEITVEMPAPEVTVTVPPMVTVPPAPAPMAPGFIWGIIVIGALLFIALIVLIIRTRRVV